MTLMETGRIWSLGDLFLRSTVSLVTEVLTMVGNVGQPMFRYSPHFHSTVFEACYRCGLIIGRFIPVLLEPRTAPSLVIQEPSKIDQVHCIEGRPQ